MRAALLAVLALSIPAFLSPVAAAERPPAAPARVESASDACREPLAGAQLAQIHCCKANKGICGCRAGKIVCCDMTASTEAGCTCHRDEGAIE